MRRKENSCSLSHDEFPLPLSKSRKWSEAFIWTYSYQHFVALVWVYVSWKWAKTPKRITRNNIYKIHSARRKCAFELSVLNYGSTPLCASHFGFTGDNFLQAKFCYWFPQTETRCENALLKQLNSTNQPNDRHSQCLILNMTVFSMDFVALWIGECQQRESSE